MMWNCLGTSICSESFARNMNVICLNLLLTHLEITLRTFKEVYFRVITLTKAAALLLFINFLGYMSWFLICDDLLMTYGPSLCSFTTCLGSRRRI